MIPTYAPGISPYTKEEIIRLKNNLSVQEIISIACPNCKTVHKVSEKLNGTYKCLKFTESGTSGCKKSFLLHRQ